MYNNNNSSLRLLHYCKSLQNKNNTLVVLTCIGSLFTTEGKNLRKVGRGQSPVRKTYLKAMCYCVRVFANIINRDANSPDLRHSTYCEGFIY